MLIPTASNDRVGLEKWVFQPVVFASVDMAKLNSVLFPFAQHFISFAGADNRSDINMTLLRTGVATRWPNRFYTYFEPSLYIDWEHDSQQGYTFELEFGRLVTNKLALWVRPGVGGGDIPWIYNWNFEVGFRYFLD